MFVCPSSTCPQFQMQLVATRVPQDPLGLGKWDLIFPIAGSRFSFFQIPDPKTHDAILEQSGTMGSAGSEVRGKVHEF
jgi:hypothetical protein